METIIFIMFCCLGIYEMSLADKRYKCQPIIDELIEENVRLKLELEKKMGE